MDGLLLSEVYDSRPERRRGHERREDV